MPLPPPSRALQHDDVAGLIDRSTARIAPARDAVEDLRAVDVLAAVQVAAL